MKKNDIHYKILDDPFTEVGPIAIGNKAFSSIGLKVQFFPENESSWVANFVLGGMKLNGVYPLEESKVLVIAGGLANIIDTDNQKVISEFGFGYENITEDKDGKIILSDPITITIIYPDGKVWNSERISMDGIKDLEIRDNVLYGLACDTRSTNPSWVPFSLHLKTKEIAGGSYILHEQRNSAVTGGS
jgi:hypothetical protein